MLYFAELLSIFFYIIIHIECNSAHSYLKLTIFIFHCFETNAEVMQRVHCAESAEKVDFYLLLQRWTNN